MVKPVRWCGSSLKDMKSLPKEAQRDLGGELRSVQRGEEPHSWKAMSTIGSGVREIRVHIEGNQFRTIYIANFEEAVYVLHVFQKKTQKTAKKDIDLVRSRYKQLLKDRTHE